VDILFIFKYQTITYTQKDQNLQAFLHLTKRGHPACDESITEQRQKRGGASRPMELRETLECF